MCVYDKATSAQTSLIRASSPPAASWRRRRSHAVPNASEAADLDGPIGELGMPVGDTIAARVEGRETDGVLVPWHCGVALLHPAAPLWQCRPTAASLTAPACVAGPPCSCPRTTAFAARGSHHPCPVSEHEWRMSEVGLTRGPSGRNCGRCSQVAPKPPDTRPWVDGSNAGLQFLV